jgi:hypothetical protein
MVAEALVGQGTRPRRAAGVVLVALSGPRVYVAGSAEHASCTPASRELSWSAAPVHDGAGKCSLVRVGWAAARSLRAAYRLFRRGATNRQGAAIQVLYLLRPGFWNTCSLPRCLRETTHPWERSLSSSTTAKP